MLTLTHYVQPVSVVGLHFFMTGVLWYEYKRDWADERYYQLSTEPIQKLRIHNNNFTDKC